MASSNPPDLEQESESRIGGLKRPASALEPTSTTPEQQTPPAKKPHRTLATRDYLDKTVVPILLEALSALAKERPSEPIDYLVAYLQNHKHEHIKQNSEEEESKENVSL